MKKITKKLTLTNIIIIITTIVYILNVFVISPETGIWTQRALETIKGTEYSSTLPFKIIGIWGGTVNEFLGSNIDKVFSGEIWRLFTVIFTHSQIAHFITNMIALAIAGNSIEKKYGFKKSLGLFVLLTSINSLLSECFYFYILENEVMTVYGASGLITSLMGMILVKSVLDKDYLKKELKKGPAICLVLYFIIFTFIVMPNIFTIIAHVGGLIIGAITELIIRKFCYKNKVA